MKSYSTTSLVFACLTISFLFGSQLAFAQLDFQPPKFIKGQTEPADMETGDFDGDQLVDIAFTTVTNSSVFIMYKELDGSYSDIHEFQAGEIVESSGYSTTITVGDFNADGKQDIVAFNGYTNNVKKIFVLLSNGRTFQTPKIIETTASLQGLGIDRGDINGDGHLDFIVGFQDLSTVLHAYLGNGSGTFTLKMVPIATTVELLRLRDVNQDGKLDILYGNKSTPALSISLGDGAGNFTIKSNLTATAVFGDFAISDFSGDNIPDIIMNTVNVESVDYFIGDGTGAFSKSTLSTIDGVKPWAGIDAFDYNADGRNDFAITGFKNGERLVVFTNTGNNQFTQTNYLNNVSSVTYHLKTIDSNQDGKFEIISAFHGRTIEVREEDNNGNFPIIIARSYGTIPHNGDAADLNQDGKLDLVTSSPSAKNIAVYYGQSNNDFSVPIFYDLKSPVYPILLYDMNLDQFQDIVYATRDGEFPEVGVILSDQTGKLVQKKVIATGASTSITAADFNKDGYPDIFTDDGCYFGDAQGNFTFSYIYMPYVMDMASGDFDKDGNVDVFATTLTSTAKFFYGNGQGGFTEENFTFLEGGHYIDVGDLNEDGLLDLVTTFENTNSISILKNMNNRMWEEKRMQHADFKFPISIEHADFDKDGIQDLILGNAYGGNITLLMGKGQFDFEVKSSYNVEGTPIDVVVAELNGDGKKDIICLNNNMKPIALLLNDLVIEPTEPPSALNFTQRFDTSVEYSFTPGDGNGRMVVVSEVLPSNPVPADNFFYAANEQFGLGAALGGGFVIRRNSDNQGKIKNLKPNTQYAITIFEYSSNQKNTLINYQASQALYATFKTKDIQTLSVPSVTDKIMGDPYFDLLVTSSSGLTPSFTIISGNIQITGNTISLLGPGPVAIKISQEGNTDFMPAPDVQISFCIKPAVPTISYTPTTGGKYLLTSSSTTNNQWLNNNVIIAGAINQTLEVMPGGPFSVKVDYSGCNNTSATLASQTINFSSIADKAEGQSPFTVSATASSTLPVSLEIKSGSATLNNSTLTLTSPGPITIKATQAGNSSFFPANPIEQTFCVIPSVPIITVTSPDLGQYILSSSSDQNNNWYKNNLPIAGATNKTYEVEEDGIYSVKVDYSGCSNTSLPTIYLITNVKESSELIAYPNPASGRVHINWPDQKRTLKRVQLYNATGGGNEVSYTLENQTLNVEITDFPSGVYLLVLQTEYELLTLKVLKK